MLTDNSLHFLFVVNIHSGTYFEKCVITECENMFLTYLGINIYYASLGMCKR